MLKLSVASIRALSIISIPAGTIPLEIISDAASPPSLIDGKPIKAALTTSGFLRILTVTSVTTPNNPSEPQINPIRSYPSWSKDFPPILQMVPSIITISTPKILFVVVPYFKEWTPPEFSATLPPIEHANWLDGSGA